MNKKVLMMTSEESFHNNYGAALQGYALYQTITDMDYDVSIIKYQGGAFPVNGRSYGLFYARRILSKLYHNIFKTKSEKASRQLHDKYTAERLRREDYFNSFKDNTMIFYNKNRIGWSKLKKLSPQADAYICGSDQIWNPYFKSEHNDPGYFLAFAPEGSLKIAYAPSFGCSDLPEPAQKSLGDLLRNYSAISVREQSGISIVKKYADRDAQLVVDPTLLRTPEQWKAIAKLPENIPDKYILCYRFAESEATRQAIDEASEKLGLPVVSLPLSDVALHDPYQFVFDAGPKEFIGLIQNAALVCTDSFHATVFSIIMQTPVCVFLRENYAKGNSMNSRVYSLLELLHLKKLIKTESEPFQKVMSCLNVDYSEAHDLLREYRGDSLNYLKNALNMSKEINNEHYASK